MFASCMSPTPATTTVPDKYQEPTLEIALDKNLFLLHQFIKNNWQEIMTDLKLPKTTKPPHIKIVTSYGPSIPEKGLIILGDYNKNIDTIRIYWRFPDMFGEFSRNAKSMVHTFLHEVLHYYDDMVGTIDSTPHDHNAIFDKRIIDLGWDKKFISKFI